MLETMQRVAILIGGVALSTGAALLLNVVFPFAPAVNPDSNHTHADFAVWVFGKRLDFSQEKYMSGSSDVEEEGEHPHEHLHESLHLHDGNGDVIHRHKPGLTIADFFGSLGFVLDPKCVRDDQKNLLCEDGDKKWRMFVNGHGRPYDPQYVFEDGDQILLSYGADDPAEIARELTLMADDACLYSKTCPWRGEPPKEGCVADPTVPCRE